MWLVWVGQGKNTDRRKEKRQQFLTPIIGMAPSSAVPKVPWTCLHSDMDHFVAINCFLVSTTRLFFKSKGVSNYFFLVFFEHI